MSADPDPVKCENSLREILTLMIDRVAADLRSLRDMLNERDRLYGQRFDAMDKANAVALTAVRESTAAAMNAAKEAVTKAETANEKRFDSVNEFRSQLKDMITTLISKDEANVRFKSVDDKVQLFSDQTLVNQGRKQGIDWLFGLICTVVGLGTGIIAAITFRH